jgi:hypothetical protein
MYRIHEILNDIKQELSTASEKNTTTEKDLQAKILTVVEIPEEEVQHVSPSNEIDEIVFEKLREFYKSKSSVLNPGDRVKNINTSCTHYGSEGIVENLEPLPDNMGNVVVYKTTNNGPNWKEGDILKKTEVQLEPMIMMVNDIMEDSNYLISDIPMNPENIDSPHHIEMMDADDESEEAPSEELDEYKLDFLKMSLGSLKAIAIHAHNILSSAEQPNVKANLTESWLQGKIAITEDYMRTIHDFVMFVQSDADDNSEAKSKLGLWENIRKKKEREGKKYRPAKPGDKDRPDPEAFKEAQK